MQRTQQPPASIHPQRPPAHTLAQQQSSSQLVKSSMDGSFLLKKRLLAAADMNEEDDDDVLDIKEELRDLALHLHRRSKYYDGVRNHTSKLDKIENSIHRSDDNTQKLLNDKNKRARKEYRRKQEEWLQKYQKVQQFLDSQDALRTKRAQEIEESLLQKRKHLDVLAQQKREQEHQKQLKHLEKLEQAQQKLREQEEAREQYRLELSEFLEQSSLLHFAQANENVAAFSDKMKKRQKRFEKSKSKLEQSIAEREAQKQQKWQKDEARVDALKRKRFEPFRRNQRKAHFEILKSFKEEHDRFLSEHSRSASALGQLERPNRVESRMDLYDISLMNALRGSAGSSLSTADYVDADMEAAVGIKKYKACDLCGHEFDLKLLHETTIRAILTKRARWAELQLDPRQAHPPRSTSEIYDKARCCRFCMQVLDESFIQNASIFNKSTAVAVNTQRQFHTRHRSKSALGGEQSNIFSTNGSLDISAISRIDNRNSLNASGLTASLLGNGE